MKTSDIIERLPAPLVDMVKGRMHDGTTSNVGSKEYVLLKDKLAGLIPDLATCIQFLRNLGYAIAMPAATVAEVNDPSRIEVIACITDSFPAGVDGLKQIRGHPLCVLVAACIRARDTEMMTPVPVDSKRPRVFEW